MKSFNSFGGFAQHLAALTAVGVVGGVQHSLLEQSAELIEERAKDKIGDYQGQAGPFGAWDELAQSTKDQRVALGYSENDPGFRSGAMRDSIQHTSDSEEAHVGSDDDKMVYFELGTDRQPARSDLGGAAFEKAPEIVKLIGSGMALHLEGKGIPHGKLLVV